jgi:(E)-4-hydroxy-3-methylbut-2-enyl-diphosphate synthase
MTKNNAEKHYFFDIIAFEVDFMRSETRQIKVGNVLIGGDNHVVIQSMTNTKTKEIDKTVNQIKELESYGCEIVRLAVLDIEDAKAIKQIKSMVNIPLVADIHYDYKLALESIKSGIDKIRINPGNIGKKENIEKVVSACKERKIPIRIGINAGSLENDIQERYGITAKAMIESAKRHVKILEELDFYDICISLKASDTNLTIEAYKMASLEFTYPLHVGVTEAGTLISGTVKSSIGIGTILNCGIGNTIRVSLTDDPKLEIKVAKEILSTCSLLNKAKLISCPTCGRTRIDLIKYAKEIEPYVESLNKPISVAVMGCSVNGIGEASHADVGIAGGIGEVVLFSKGKIVKKVKEEDAIKELKILIENML